MSMAAGRTGACGVTEGPAVDRPGPTECDDGGTAKSVAETIRDWVGGWVLSRGAAEPVEEPWGFTIDVGLTGHMTRHVVTRPDEETVRDLAVQSGAPGKWLKIFVERDRLEPWLTTDWTFDKPGYLMTVPLPSTAAPMTPPQGYRLRSWTHGDVTRVLLAAPDGSFAACGQVAVNGAVAVMDRVETGPDHRRRGLGGFIMRTLAATAHEAGAGSAVLGATPEGRALYESLGWKVRAPLTSLVYGRKE